jgi:hypothetical protein
MEVRASNGPVYQAGSKKESASRSQPGHHPSQVLSTPTEKVPDHNESVLGATETLSISTTFRSNRMNIYALTNKIINSRKLKMKTLLNDMFHCLFLLARM